MTREEAIEIIRNYDVYGCGYCHQGGDEVEEAFDMAIKALKQEPIIDKIRAELEELRHYYPMGHDYQLAITRCIAVIDKYKAESEGK